VFRGGSRFQQLPRFRQLLSLAALCASGWPCGCHHDSTPATKRDPAVLDGMERSSARRVGLETASDAMRRGDLKQLKMLGVWARNRAQVVLFEADDLQSLDVAIACLDGSLAPSDRRSALDKIQSGQLLKPARTLCLDQAD
jgi:hypothetical protein